MKTIYTDRLGALPWLWVVSATIWLVFLGFFDTTTERRLFHGALALVSAALAFREFRRRRRAVREGRDPAIVRIRE